MMEEANEMIVVGIDPGWRNFAVTFVRVDSSGWHTLTSDNVDLLPNRKRYNLQAMRCALDKWYLSYQHILRSAKIVIEKQMYMRMQNIVNHLCFLMPHAVLLSPILIKKEFNIGTGRHYTNKKAVVELCKHMVDANDTFKSSHNKLDSMILAYYYAKHVLKLDVPDLKDIKF